MIPAIQAIPLVFRYLGLDLDVALLRLNRHDVVKADPLKSSVLRVLLRVSKQKELHVQRDLRSVDRVLCKALLRVSQHRFPAAVLRPRDDRAVRLLVFFANRVLAVHDIDPDERVVPGVLGVHIQPFQEQVFVRSFEAPWNDPRDHVLRVPVPVHAAHIDSVLDRDPGPRVAPVQQVEIPVVPHQIRVQRFDQAVARVQQRVHRVFEGPVI